MFINTNYKRVNKFSFGAQIKKCNTVFRSVEKFMWVKKQIKLKMTLKKYKK